MAVFRILDKILGATLITLIFSPLIALASISRLFNFIDLLYRGQTAQAFRSIILSPITALLTLVLGVTIVLGHGWNTGLLSLISTFPTRTMHFFRKQLFFGSQENESINDFFVSSLMPTGFNFLVTSGFFGQLTLKLLSLCTSMEYYLSYDAKSVSPHNDVSLYFTEKNLNILKEKYESVVHEQAAQISIEIKDYLAEKLQVAKFKVEEVSHLPSSDDTKAGKLQSARDELNTIQAAQRCVKYFEINTETAPDLSNKFQCAPSTVLNFIWLAINNECQNGQDALKEKLIWALFQIQRGFNIVNGGNGKDMPECPTGSIGLLVRVICDEQEKMPGSEYQAADPSPANLSLALKGALDRPFISSHDSISRMLRQNFNENPTMYRQGQKNNMINTWRIAFAPLIDSGKLNVNNLEEIIDAGVDAWEPPSENGDLFLSSVERL